MMRENVYRVYGHDLMTGEAFDSVHVAFSVKVAITKHESVVLKLGKTDDLKWWVIDRVECQD